MADRTPVLGLDTLRTQIERGDVDTVVVAFTDMQGRLQGKRLHAPYFLDHVLEHGTEGCNYLLAVDVDMNTVEGYAISSWERGYGDMEFAIDLDTLRPVPWLPGTVMVQCDLTWLDDAHTPVVESPAADPARPGGQGSGEGLDGLRRHRARVHRVRRHLRGRVERRLPRPHAVQPVQRRLLAARHHAGRAAAARHPQPHVRQRPGRRVGQGRVQPRPARDRVPLRRGADAPPTTTPSTRTGRRRSRPCTARR